MIKSEVLLPPQIKYELSFLKEIQPVTPGLCSTSFTRVKLFSSFEI